MMKPQRMAPDAAMMVLKAKVQTKHYTTANIYRPKAMVQHANNALLVWCWKQWHEHRPTHPTRPHKGVVETTEGWLPGAPPLGALMACSGGPGVGPAKHVGQGSFSVSPGGVFGGALHPQGWVPRSAHLRIGYPPLALPPSARDTADGRVPPLSSCSGPARTEDKHSGTSYQWWQHTRASMGTSPMSNCPRWSMR